MVKSPQYYHAEALLKLARDKRKELLYIIKLLADVLEVKPETNDYFGYVSDSIWEDYDIDELINRINLGKDKNNVE